MSIDPDDVALVRETRTAFAESPDRTAEMFYAALFREAPGLRDLFPDDMTDQGRKLCAMLNAAIQAADDWPTLAPVLDDLARRHLRYGVHAEHYAPVGRALLAAVAGGGATAAQITAWSDVYEAIRARMVTAAYGGPTHA